VELHSGVIEAYSDGRNLGAKFVVRLPLARRLETDLEAKKGNTSRGGLALPRKGVRVLLVEDHEPTRATLERLLSSRNYSVMTASCVTEARVLVRKHQFQLVISDIGLPDGNGYDLLKEILNSQRVKGIALTGYGMEQDVQKSRASGFSIHLTKPIRVQSLEEALSELSV